MRLAFVGKSIYYYFTQQKLVVNISVDKELKWDIKSGNSIVMLPSSIALQTDKACLGKNMKVSKASIYNKVENVDKADVWGIKANRPYQGLKLSGNGYDVEFRVFNDAASYRFVPKNLSIELSTKLLNIFLLAILRPLYLM